MRVRFASVTASGFLVAVLLGGASTGCGAGATAGGAQLHGPEGANAAAPRVSDDAFPAEVRALLAAAPGTAERAARLSGTLGRQMARSAARFQAHGGASALGMVGGGLALVHTGELGGTTLGPSARDALRGAARELSGRGDEGRARGIFEIWSRLAPDSERKDIQGHLEALAAWMRDTVARGGPVAAAGALEAAAVKRALVEPSVAALNEANQRTTEWLARALELRSAEGGPKKAPPPREEVGEALRALQSGGALLVALHLRDVDAKGALAAVDAAQARELVRPDLMRALEEVAAKPNAERWLDVLRALRPQREGANDDDGANEDDDAVRAASFSVAREAYRLDSTQVETAGAVAAALQEYGMSDATPAVLVDAVRAHPEPRVVSGALAITMHVMAGQVEDDDAAGARRAYRAGAPLLALADDKGLAGKLQPSAARVRALMGDIELREGRLDDAHALLGPSAASEKSGTVLLSLARIERHAGRTGVALALLRDALEASDAGRDPALRGELLLETSDILRQGGDLPKARAPLTEAVKLLTKGRNTPDGDDRARLERVLARVLDRFGADAAAQRALERAYEAAPRDKHQAAATVGQMVSRAFVRGDLRLARDGLARGLAADLEPSDLVYYALWVRLLERQQGRPTDGTPGRIFSGALDDGRWIGRLAGFGAGLVKPVDLLARAETPSQKTEALFYAAMDLRASAGALGVDEALRKVVQSDGIELIEMAIARDVLDGPKAQVGGPLPAEAKLP